MALPTKVQNYLAVLTPTGQLTENQTLQAFGRKIPMALDRINFREAEIATAPGGT
jgi:hypothetical protein